jgi:hypothetical protein
MTEGFSAEPALDRPEAPDARDAQLAVARAALRRLSLIDEMAGMGQRDDDPELRARCRHAAGALATMDRLVTEGPQVPQEAAEGRLARVEVKGFRDLGIVRVTESTLAGEAMLRAETADGAVAEFPASSLHFITWLPPGVQAQGRPAITRANPDYDGDGWDSRDDGLDDEDDGEMPF